MMFTRIFRHGLAAAMLLSLPLSATIAAQEHLATWLGGGAHERLSTLAVLGDVDGDGVPDHALGSPEASDERGHVSVISGATGEELWRVAGSVAGERMGHALAGELDSDLDGVPDVIIGIPGAAGSSLPGRVQVRSGADGSLLQELLGSQPGARLGFSVSAVGDLDFDGRDDLLVGAPFFDGPAGIDAGAVYAFSSHSGALLHELHAELPGDLLGFSLHGSIHVGDGGADPIIGCTLMGDGGIDPVIGAPQLATGGAGYLLKLSHPGLTSLVRTEGTAPGDAFGISASQAGDVDGDGTADLIGGSQRGYARVISGATGLDLALLSSGDGSDGFGSVVAGIGDVDGDGLDDLAVGAPLSDGDGVAGSGAGSVSVYSGAGGQLMHLLYGAAGAGLGRNLSLAGDLDGDSLADLAVVAPGDSTAGQSPGSVFVFSMARWTDLHGGVPGEDGVPLMAGSGETNSSSTVELSLAGARPDADAVLVAGTSLVYDPALSVFAPSQELLQTGLRTDAQGALTALLQLPVGLSPDTLLYYQFIVADPSGPSGQSRSNAMASRAQD